jgi:hypothetical protein
MSIWAATNRVIQDPWILEWTSTYEDHGYEPVYLGNARVGGMVDLSGVTADWWSSRTGSLATGGVAGVLYPVTALRTQALFRNAAWESAGIWAGRSGIFCADKRYTSDPSMPHRPQVYGARQNLDLRRGVLTTEGTLYLGSEAAWRAGLEPERGVRFTVRVAALKDSDWIGFELTADGDAEIAFLPERLAEERLALGGKAKGAHKLGNDLECDLRLSQRFSAMVVEHGRIGWTAEPEDGLAYRVEAYGGAALAEVGPGPALAGRGRLFVAVRVSPGGTAAVGGEAPEWTRSSEAFFAEQERRWSAFWAASGIELPVDEALWQQRYHASLFNVAQSVGEGPTHPGGLSRPMLPYWFGCFHDTDTYFCRALLESGRTEQAAQHLAYRHRGLGEARAMAQRLGRSGALYPWQTDARGRGDTHDVPVNGAILAVEAWHHFAYGRQPEARAKAAEIVGETLRNLWDHVDDGATPLRLKARGLMTFSETMTSEDPTEARVALRAVAAAWLAAGGGDAELDARARRTLAELELPVGKDGAYRLTAPGDAEPAYMRCPSVILGSFPLHALAADATLARTFEKELARIVFLFAWLPHQASVVASQLGLREGPASASGLLRAADSFYKPWHAYDEWENRRAARAANFVTAAGGFATAMHHMLVAETRPGVWTLFAGAPEGWRDVAFRGLVTRAGWRVTARREGGNVAEVEAEPVGAASEGIFALEWNEAGCVKRREWRR